MAFRTWFTTLTAEPEQHYQVYCRALQELGRGFRDEKEEFLWRHKILGRDVTKWLKRLRTNHKVPFRYVIVVEEHKDNLKGLPHYHALLHETVAGSELRYRQLSAAWRSGFSEHELVQSEFVTDYVTKYLGKSSNARVRASLDYGIGTVRTDLHSGLGPT